jgi:hypothetical protein
MRGHRTGAMRTSENSSSTTFVNNPLELRIILGYRIHETPEPADHHEAVYQSLAEATTE